MATICRTQRILGGALEMEPVNEFDLSIDHSKQISGLSARDIPKKNTCTQLEVIVFVLNASDQPLTTPLPPPTRYKKTGSSESAESASV